MYLKNTIILFLFIFSQMVLNAQTVVINEVVSSNLSVNADQDGDFEDWIELFNSGNSPVDLSDYGLSDDSTNFQKWIFPKTIILPNGFLFVWASGKDRRPDENSLTNGIVRQMYSNIGGNKLDSLFSNPKYPDRPDKEQLITDFFEAPKNVGDKYGVKTPWPDLIDFESQSLQLFDANSDNLLAANRKMSDKNDGNPGIKNLGIINAVPFFAQEDKASLNQNYPNPFQSATRINYSVETYSNVQIDMVNILGHIAKTIINRTHSEGSNH